MSDAFAAIRARHDDIPQDPLPLEIPNAGVRRHDGRREKSVAQAICPWHVARGEDDTTGLVRAGVGLVFREHTRRVGRTTNRCPGSGRAPEEMEE